MLAGSFSACCADDFPRDVLAFIFTFLTITERFRVIAGVSKSFRNALRCPILWQSVSLFGHKNIGDKELQHLIHFWHNNRCSPRELLHLPAARLTETSLLQLHKLTQLRGMCIWNGPWTQYIRPMLCSLPQLEWLHLAYCALTDFRFPIMPRLKSLELTACDLCNMRGLHRQPMLSSLRLNGCSGLDGQRYPMRLPASLTHVTTNPYVAGPGTSLPLNSSPIRPPRPTFASAIAKMTNIHTLITDMASKVLHATQRLSDYATSSSFDPNTLETTTANANTNAEVDTPLHQNTHIINTHILPHTNTHSRKHQLTSSHDQQQQTHVFPKLHTLKCVDVLRDRELELITRLPAVHELDIVIDGVTCVGFRALGSITSLKSLTLSTDRFRPRPKYSDSDIALLCSLPNLHTLSLVELPGITEACFTHLSALPSLTSLSLLRCHGIASVCGVAQCTKLRSLHVLSRNFSMLSDEDAEAVSQLVDLNYLQISAFPTNHGMARIAGALRKLRAFQMVQCGNHIPFTEVAFAYLRSMHRLEDLVMPFVGDSVSALVPHFKPLRKLKRLVLYGMYHDVLSACDHKKLRACLPRLCMLSDNVKTIEDPMFATQAVF